MHMLHCFECVRPSIFNHAAPVLARVEGGHATALKPTHEAGRRGGESIARRKCIYFIFFEASGAAARRSRRRRYHGRSMALRGV